MEAPTLNPQLVTEGNVTIGLGESPVLPLLGEAPAEIRENIARTVNFLRSGCGRVQWLVVCSVDPQDGPDHQRLIDATLASLELEREQLRSKVEGGAFEEGAVISFTRLLPQGRD